MTLHPMDRRAGTQEITGKYFRADNSYPTQVCEGARAKTNSVWAFGFGLRLDSTEASSWRQTWSTGMNTKLRVRRFGFKS